MAESEPVGDLTNTPRLAADSWLKARQERDIHHCLTDYE